MVWSTTATSSAERVQVDLVAQAGAEGRHGPGRVVAGPVETAVNGGLQPAEGGLEQGGHGQCVEQPVGTASTSPADPPGSSSLSANRTGSPSVLAARPRVRRPLRRASARHTAEILLPAKDGRDYRSGLRSTLTLAFATKPRWVVSGARRPGPGSPGSRQNAGVSVSRACAPQGPAHVSHRTAPLVLRTRLQDRPTSSRSSSRRPARSASTLCPSSITGSDGHPGRPGRGGVALLTRDRARHKIEATNGALGRGGRPGSPYQRGGPGHSRAPVPILNRRSRSSASRDG
jgi:hypothetical protein